jgi:V/A-type H+-transporting ATPase subunit F
LYNVVVITDEASSVGFRLAGVEVREATPETAAQVVKEVIDKRDVGLIAINEDFVRGFDQRMMRIVAESEMPLIIPFPPVVYTEERREVEESYAAQLIRKAIGYHIKLTK